VTPDRSSGHLSSVSIRRLRESWVIVALLAICLLMAAGGDSLRELSRYERLTILSGEYWRLVSGHLVHLGFGHLWPNVAALAVVGLLFEDVFRSRDWIRVAVCSAAAIDVGLLAFEPAVLWYVGLSGVLHGFVAAGALALLMRRETLGAVLALGLTAKLVFEQLVGPMPFTAQSVGGPVVVAAHLYGAVGAVLAEAAAQVARRRSRL
jgi:rhomboid family GlyGly-CTERM serine protease